MKTVCSWMFFGAMATGLLSGPSVLRAQPVSNSAEIDDETPSDDEPVPPNAKPTSRDDKPAPLGSEQVIGPAILALNAPDKPWSRGVSMEDRRAARDLFLEGNRLFRIPLFAKAAEKYVAALGKWKHPVIYLNLAIAELNAGQDVESRDSLEHALEHGEEPLGAENFQGARLQLELVTRQLGRIRVTCRTQGAQVTLDGEPLFIGPGSYEGWVKAKDHEITANKPDYLSEARRVTVVSGQLQNTELKLITLSEATDASRRWSAWKPRAITAVGGAIMAAGGVLHTFSYRNFSVFDDKINSLTCVKPGSSLENFSGCSRDNPKLTEANIILKHARMQQRLAIGSYIVGGSLTAVGIVLLYLNRPRLEKLRTMNAGAEGIAITPAVTNDIFSVLVDMYY